MARLYRSADEVFIHYYQLRERLTSIPSVDPTPQVGNVLGESCAMPMCRSKSHRSSESKKHGLRTICVACGYTWPVEFVMLGRADVQASRRANAIEERYVTLVTLGVIIDAASKMQQRAYRAYTLHWRWEPAARELRELYPHATQRWTAHRVRTLVTEARRRIETKLKRSGLLA